MLDVGSGSGYLTIIFAYLVGAAGSQSSGMALGVDIIPDLVERAALAAQQIPFAADMLKQGTLQFNRVRMHWQPVHHRRHQTCTASMESYTYGQTQAQGGCYAPVAINQCLCQFAGNVSAGVYKSGSTLIVLLSALVHGCSCCVQALCSGALQA